MSDTPADFSLTGRAGTAIVLPIGQPPATGHGWWLDLPPGLARVEDAPAPPPPAAAALGAPAGGALRVTGAPGRYRITARLARPWARDQPIRTLVIDLVIE
ncbi:hypothetical protein [Sphingomonas morindae]|uniref:Proteinase inhibitor I42 chagasin domain-containing protein n=1 Tax=Sphingomonas morindae TaxID=1541170 RepID=A0ABY4XDH0_9SPHN|nr:hypothetical protein [Sphingomonas morindae]USI74968.1 hypothetical protein LHA26_17525 [Sphingomonas morindae]